MRICELITALPAIKPLSGSKLQRQLQRVDKQREQQARQREQAAKKQQRLQRQQDAAWRRRHHKSVQGAAKWRVNAPSLLPAVKSPAGT
jgi:hypothetical protein